LAVKEISLRSARRLTSETGNSITGSPRPEDGISSDPSPSAESSPPGTPSLSGTVDEDRF
jgi:hypothetical protein